MGPFAQAHVRRGCVKNHSAPIEWRLARPKRRVNPYIGRMHSQDTPANTSHKSAWLRWVPVRPLRKRHRPKVLKHLLDLDAHDRYMRFGHHATQEQIQAYVEGLDFGYDQLLGVFNRRLELIAFAHLALSVRPRSFHTAEFGVSVMGHARGRGYGGRLFDRAMTAARNHGITHLQVHALSENAPMIRIAQRAGAHIERHGSESEALLRLPPADFDSHLKGIWQDKTAVVDYHWKSGTRGWLAPVRWWRALKQLWISGKGR